MNYIDIIDYEGLYTINEEGIIRSCSKVKGRTGDNIVNEGVLKLQLKRSGRLVAKLLKNGKPKFWLVHRLVGIHFVPNPDNKPDINHIDGNPLNNHKQNLEWVTPSENIRHAYKTGLMKGLRGKDRRQSKPVIKMDLKGTELAFFESISQAANFHGFAKGNIIACCKDKYEQCYGFKWKYA